MTYYVGPGVPKGPAAHPWITKLGMLTAFIMANLWAYLLLPLGWIVFPCANLFALALSACVFCCSCGDLKKDDVEGPWPATIEFEGTPTSPYFHPHILFCCCGVSEGDSDAAKEIDLKYLVTCCGEPDPGCCCGIFSKSETAPLDGYYYTLSAKSGTGRTPEDPTNCCCTICGSVTFLVWAVLILIIGSLFFGLCFGAGANIILFAFTTAMGACGLGLTQSEDFSVLPWNISFTYDGGEPMPPAQYKVAYCCFGLKEQSDGSQGEVDPEAPAPAPAAGAKKPTVPIPKKAYLTAMKKSHGLL